RTSAGPQRVKSSLPTLARHSAGSRRSSMARVSASPAKSSATMMRLGSVLMSSSPLLSSLPHYALDRLDRAPLHAARAKPVQVLHLIAAVPAAVHGPAFQVVVEDVVKAFQVFAQWSVFLAQALQQAVHDLQRGLLAQALAQKSQCAPAA